MFADDTVVYCATRDRKQIVRDLNEDLESIAAYFYENDLMINLKNNLCCLERITVVSG